MFPVIQLIVENFPFTGSSNSNSYSDVSQVPAKSEFQSHRPSAVRWQMRRSTQGITYAAFAANFLETVSVVTGGELLIEKAPIAPKLGLVRSWRGGWHACGVLHPPQTNRFRLLAIMLVA
jgi:hypothetical protein